MKDWRRPIIASLAALSLVAVGCNGGGGDTSGTTSGTTGSTTATTGTTGTGGTTAIKQKDIKIAMIAKSTTNPVFQSAKTGAEKAAADLNAQYKDQGLNVTIDWLTPNNEDGQEQAKRITQGVNQGDNVVLISCSDATKVTQTINDVSGRGIPVMTFDSDAPDSKRFAFYGVNDEESGQMVMKELAAQLGDKGNVAILAGNQNAPNLQKRVQGVKDEAAKHPGIKIVNVFNHKETPEDAAAMVKQTMLANPQINGWAMIGGWPLFTKTLLTDLDPAKVKIVSIDALPAELAYIDKGIAPVLLAQPTFKWGYESVKIIVDHVAFGKDVQPINKMDLVKVTKDNLGEWANQLKDWGFTDVDQKYLDMKSTSTVGKK